MFYTKLNNAIKGFAFIFAVAFGLILTTGVDASAQGRGNQNVYRERRGWDDNDRKRDDRYNGRDRNGNQSLKFAYERGYREGFNDGRRNARNGGYDNNRGNRHGWGNDYRFQQAYQNGYRQGYRDAVNRYRRNTRNNNGSWWPF